MKFTQKQQLRKHRDLFYIGKCALVDP